MSDLDESVVSKGAMRKKKKARGKVAKNDDQEIVINTVGEDLELNLEKQYDRNVEYCDRVEMRCHDPKRKKTDRGSVKDDRLRYMEFQAGLFVALKANMIRILKDLNIFMHGTPSIDSF